MSPHRYVGQPCFGNTVPTGVLPETCMQASVTCALTGPLQIADYKAIAGAEGHEVFSERKGLNSLVMC